MFGLYSSGIQIPTDVSICLSGSYTFKDFPNNLRFFRMDLIPAILSAPEAERHRSAGKAFFRIVFVSAPDFLGQLCRIVLRQSFKHRFDQDSGRIVRDRFGRRHDSDTAGPELVLVSGRIVFVTREPIQRVHQNGTKTALSRVLYHLEELWTAVCSSGQGAI